MTTPSQAISMTASSDLDRSNRSEAVRAAIKKYYIYVVLLLIVVIFSLVKVNRSGCSAGEPS